MVFLPIRAVYCGTPPRVWVDLSHLPLRSADVIAMAGRKAVLKVEAVLTLNIKNGRNCHFWMHVCRKSEIGAITT